MSIPQQIIDEILNKSDIVDIVSELIPLKQAGRNHRALCPFHQEKTPSFMVNPEKQIFHCFGCGAGGNTVSFLMKYHQIGFPDALEILAKRTGVTLEHSTSKKVENGRTEQIETLEKLTLIFEDVFWKSKEADAARNYLKDRNLNEDLLRKMRIGYCPVNESGMMKLLRDKDINMGVLEKLGLLSSKGGRTYALRFYGRIIFPICDAMGKVLGFGGRAMDEKGPKYLNSSESGLFNKSKLFYGLHLAKNAASQKGFMILTEGYIDMMRLYGSGFENVVASLGTAFNENHAVVLKRYVNEVVLSYDGDDAGMSAALRAMDVFLSHDISVRVAVLPSDEDPDSYVLRFGQEAFEKILQNALPLSDFKLHQMCKGVNISSEAGKLSVVRDMTLWMQGIENTVLREEIFKKIAHKLDISEKALRLEFKRMRPNRQIIVDKNKSENVQKCTNSSENAEIEIIRILLEDAQLKKKYAERIKGLSFKSKVYNNLLEKALSNKQPSEWNLDALEPSTALIIQPTTYPDKEKALIDYITYLEQIRYDEIIHALKIQLRTVKDEAQVQEIVKKIQDLKNQFRKDIASK
ncbi:MAG: DNA primase [Chlamydiota bacterium]|nr:DNA primase [Chlamydiota bacterium]